jgi:hypothetical protein
VIEQAEAHLRGEQRARDLLAVLRVSLTDGDELLRVIRTCPTDELPGLARLIQKCLDRSAR